MTQLNNPGGGEMQVYNHILLHPKPNSNVIRVRMER